MALEVLARRADLKPAIGVELAPVTDAGNVPMAILTALGLAVTSPGSTSDRTTDVTSRLVEILQSQSSVLLLDNCEHLVDAVAALAEELLQRCPMLTIVATSREPLMIPGESQFLVAALHREAVAAMAAMIVCTRGRDADDTLLARAERCGAAAPGDDRVLAMLDEARAIVLARQGDLDAAGAALTAAMKRRRDGGLTTPWWLEPHVDDVLDVVG